MDHPAPGSEARHADAGSATHPGAGRLDLRLAADPPMKATMPNATPHLRVPVIADASTGIGERLRGIWETRPGFWGALCSVDHKEIGLRYLVTSFVFLLLGGLEAAVIRLQLAQPNGTVLTPEAYNQLLTMHGVTMIFLYALPVLSGFSNYLWPLILGSRDMAFPRLNALSYWICLAAGR